MHGGEREREARERLTVAVVPPLRSGEPPLYHQVMEACAEEKRWDLVIQLARSASTGS